MSTGRNQVLIIDMTHANDVVREYYDCTPTLQNRMGTGGNQVPLVVYKVYDPSRRHEYADMGDVCDTLQAHMGTGGGNVPIALKVSQSSAVKDETDLQPKE